MDTEPLEQMIYGDQREGAEAPEHECVGEADPRPGLDHFPLKQDIPDELPWADTRLKKDAPGIRSGEKDKEPDAPGTAKKKRKRTEKNQDENNNFSG